MYAPSPWGTVGMLVLFSVGVRAGLTEPAAAQPDKRHGTVVGVVTAKGEN